MKNQNSESNVTIHDGEDEDERQWVDITNEEKQKEEEWNLPTVKVRSRAPTAGISKTPINFIKAVLKVTDS